jgi:hypothetical protein
MKPSYKQITQIEGYYGGNEFVGINIQLALKREVTKEESFEMVQHLEAIVKMLRKNDLLNNEEYQKEIQEERKSLLECFPSPIYVKEIPNEYNSDSLKPWFLVTTTKGVIKIGWRKRVIEIEWETDLNRKSAMDLFPEEEVTRSSNFDRPHYIHAWGYDKAKEYIKKILN